MLAHRSRPSRSTSRWGRRLVASAGVLITVALTSSPSSAAPPVPQSTSATPSTETVEELQQRAAEVQQKFMEASISYESAQQRVNDAKAKAEQAQGAEAAARAEMEAQQEVLGQYMATIYTMGIEEQHPMLKVIAYGPEDSGDIMHDQQIADLVGDQQNEILEKAQDASARAEAASKAAKQAEDDAANAQAEAQDLLDQIQAEAAAVMNDLNQNLSALGASAADAQQQARNEAALKNWQDYLQRLSDAKIVAPAAVTLADPAHLPAGLEVVLNAAGQPIVGIAQKNVNGQMLTVLPAETISAVSHGFSQVGKPYVAGQAGPDSYDCAGFTATSWNKSGYPLATTVTDQWTRGAAVAKEDAQIGDLVFFTGPGTGLQHVGLYLGGGFVLDSSAARYQVGVEEMPQDFYSAVRVTLPAPAAANETPAAEGAIKMTCGAIEAPVGAGGTPQWGGFPNGMIPSEALCSAAGGQMLRCDAAAAYTAMSSAYQGAFGSPMCITDSYRSFASQVTTYANKPGLAAVPGTSNHGWGLAVDLCGGVDSFGSAQYAWMKANAPRFGWVHPSWAEPGNGREEPWHWEFGYVS